MSTLRVTADFAEEHVLSDGTRVTVRPIRPDDKRELARAFAGLSDTSRFRRFMSYATELDEPTLRYLTEVDLVDHVALVAVTDSLDLRSDVGLGVARFIRLPAEPHVAEAAVTIADAAQRKGLGRILMQALALAAVERDIAFFRGQVLATNLPMRHLLEQAGATVRDAAQGPGDPHEDGESLVFEVPLGDAVDRIRDESEHPLRRLLRAVAEAFSSRRD